MMGHMNSLTRAFGILCLAALVAGAAPDKADEKRKPKRYADCMILARDKPERAYRMASTWGKEGGGHPARHCAAAAMIGMGMPAEAAQRLEDLAYAVKPDKAAMRGNLLAQAAGANAGFIGHTMMPHKQDADIVRAKTHPVMAGLPERWSHYDEWYAFDKNPDLAGATVIANVDEASYDPGKYSMSPTHPVIWVKDIGEGRSLYSALGHSEKSFETPEYQQLLAQAIAWTGRLEQQEKP